MTGAITTNSRTFPLPPNSPIPIDSQSHLPLPWQQLIYFLPLWIYLFQTFYINGIMQYGAFCIWLCSVRIMLLRLIQVIAFLYSSWGSHGKYTRVVCHFPPPVDHIFSELYTMTHPSWVALHSMAPSFIEFLCRDKAVMWKLLKRWEYQTILPVSWETCMRVKNNS